MTYKTGVQYCPDKGNILCIRKGSLSSLLKEAEKGAHTLILPEDSNINIDDYYVDVQTKTLEYLPKASQPSPAHFYNYKNKVWEVDILEYRDYIWSKVKEYYEDKEEEGLYYLGNIYDSDSKSRDAVAQAALSASIDFTLSFYWTIANNTTVHLSSDQILELHSYMNSFVQGLRALRSSDRETIYSTYKESTITQVLTSKK